MKQSRLGWHIDGNTGVPWDYLAGVLKEYRPTTLLVINGSVDNLGLLRGATAGQTLIANRNWAKGDEWHHVTPQDWARMQTSWGFPQYPRQVVNEPDITPQHTLKDYINWSGDVGQELLNRGYMGILGNFAVGTWQPEDIDAGVYDPLIKLVSEHPDKLWIGVHEYTLVSCVFGFGFQPANDLLNTLAQQPDRWNIPPTGARWWYGRCEWFLDRAKAINLPALPHIWINEFGFDEITVPAPNGQTMKDLLVQQYGRGDGCNTFGGIRGCAKVWEDHYFHSLGWKKEEAAYRMLTWASEQYRPEIVGMNFWSITKNPQWVEDDYSDLGAFFDLLKRYNPMPPQPQPLPVPPPIVVPPPLTWRGVPVSDEFAKVIDALLGWGERLKHA